LTYWSSPIIQYVFKIEPIFNIHSIFIIQSSISEQIQTCKYSITSNPVPRQIQTFHPNHTKHNICWCKNLGCSKPLYNLTRCTTTFSFISACWFFISSCTLILAASVSFTCRNSSSESILILQNLQDFWDRMNCIKCIWIDKWLYPLSRFRSNCCPPAATLSISNLFHTMDS
jgi:hypothetical protein